jgi:hypothetical protein
MSSRGWAVVAAVACGCASREAAPEVAATPVETAAVAPAAPAAPAVVADAAPAAVATTDGADFTAEAKLLYRVAACGGSDPVPERFDAAVIDRHCGLITTKLAAFRTRYFEGVGRAFFAGIVPADAPSVVVYPFGGGDLISALVAFPDATEITTISLELSGDPRRIDTIDAKRLKWSLAALRVGLGGMLSVGSNTSANLSASQKNELPAQISSFLIGLAAGGYQPVGMRFFRLADDGSIEYLTAEAIADLQAAEGRNKATRRKLTWESPNFSEAFAHVEIRYVAPGDPTVRVHRHLGWNLSNTYLKDHGQLLRHLEAKGRVTLLTKGASYLLWSPEFSMIRDYMLANLAWMVSDSTGIPPQIARKAGMVQDTYGLYTDAFLPHARGTKSSLELAKLFARNPKRVMPFRFGYVDVSFRAHLVVTRPAPAP